MSKYYEVSKIDNISFTGIGDSISNNQLEANEMLQEKTFLPSSIAGSKLISSIALTKPLSAEQQKKRAAMLFGKDISFYIETNVESLQNNRK